jgi:hypothetical protein
LLCLPLPFPSPATLLPQDPAGRLLGLINYLNQSFIDCESHHALLASCKILQTHLDGKT